MMSLTKRRLKVVRHSKIMFWEKVGLSHLCKRSDEENNNNNNNNNNNRVFTVPHLQRAEDDEVK